jgi:hypothetical protein
LNCSTVTIQTSPYLVACIIHQVYGFSIGAVQAELRRQGLLDETDRYLQDLVAEVGAPNANAMAKADTLSGRVRRARTDRRAS